MAFEISISVSTPSTQAKVVQPHVRGGARHIGVGARRVPHHLRADARLGVHAFPRGQSAERGERGRGGVAGVTAVAARLATGERHRAERTGEGRCAQRGVRPPEGRYTGGDTPGRVNPPYRGDILGAILRGDTLRGQTLEGRYPGAIAQGGDTPR